MAKGGVVWTDNAVRFVPHPVASVEENEALIWAAIATTPVEQTVKIAKRLLEQAATDPARLFYPVIWQDTDMACRIAEEG